MKTPLREGDIYFSKSNGEYFIHKVLRVEKSNSPVMHLLSRGPVRRQPRVDQFGKYPVYRNHHTLEARHRQEVHYLGNQPVEPRELNGYLSYLKNNDYDAYLLERGQNPDDIYEKAGEAYNNGVDCFEEEQYQAAINHFDRALRLYPPLRVAHLARGYCFLAQANLERAWEDLRTAYRHFDKDEDLGRLLVNISLERGMPDSATEYLTPLIKDQPDDPELVMYQGYIFLEQKDYGQAWDAFRYAQELAPEDPQYFYNLACYHAVRYERTGALEYLELALRRGYDDREYLLFDRHLQSIQSTKGFAELIRRFFPSM